jgi:hypothetical protein
MARCATKHANRRCLTVWGSAMLAQACSQLPPSLLLSSTKGREQPHPHFVIYLYIIYILLYTYNKYIYIYTGAIIYKLVLFRAVL